jgi:hypothetical protein
MVAPRKTIKKPVGRPAAKPATEATVTTTAQENVEALRTEGQREMARQPRKRIPFGAPRSKLVVPVKPEGYHLHWVNDDAGRLFAAQQGYYEFCSPNEVGMEDTDGSGKVKVLVGKNAQNAPLFAYLMKIKLEYYEEDKALISSQQDSFEEAIRRGQNSNGEYGYVPKEGIKFS